MSRIDENKIIERLANEIINERSGGLITKNSALARMTLYLLAKIERYEKALRLVEEESHNHHRLLNSARRGDNSVAKTLTFIGDTAREALKDLG